MFVDPPRIRTDHDWSAPMDIGGLTSSAPDQFMSRLRKIFIFEGYSEGVINPGGYF